MAATLFQPLFASTQTLKPASSLLTWNLNHTQPYHQHKLPKISRNNHYDHHHLKPLFCSFNPHIRPTKRCSKNININRPIILQTLVPSHQPSKKKNEKNHDTRKSKFNIVKFFVKVGISVLLGGAVSLVTWKSNNIMMANHLALACSGGCMGGSDFSSSDSSSWSSDSSSSWSDSSSSWSVSSDDDWGGTSSCVDDEGIREFFVVLFEVGCGCLFITIVFSSVIWYLSKPTIFMIQIASVDENREIQKEINAIGKSSSTSSSHGWIHILRATAKTLLQNSDSWISTAVHTEACSSIAKAESYFHKLSSEERKKFDKVTFYNVNDTKVEQKEIGEDDGSCNYTMVIILVAVTGLNSKPTIRDREDVKKALHKLCSTDQSHIKAVQVLWTPQLEDDTLTKERLDKDYPHLISL